MAAHDTRFSGDGVRYSGGYGWERGTFLFIRADRRNRAVIRSKLHPLVDGAADDRCAECPTFPHPRDAHGLVVRAAAAARADHGVRRGPAAWSAAASGAGRHARHGYGPRGVRPVLRRPAREGPAVDPVERALAAFVSPAGAPLALNGPTWSSRRPARTMMRRTSSWSGGSSATTTTTTTTTPSALPRKQHANARLKSCRDEVWSTAQGEPYRNRTREHPLPTWHARQDVVDELGGAVLGAARRARGADAASLA